jgi:hypothetical protein
VHWFSLVKTSVSQVLEVGKACGVSAVELTVKVVAACAGNVGMRLKAAIIPATSSAAARALVFLVHTDTSLFIWVVIFLCSVLPPSSGGGTRLVRLKGL